MLWVLALLGVFPGDITGVNLMVAFPLTILVIVAKAAEYLTRPAIASKKSIR